MSSRLVLLDACVLVPQRLSSLLLTMAEQALFAVRWSEEILDEVERALVGDLGLDPQRAGRRLAAMRHAFPEASVAEYSGLMEGLECDPKDRHVLAAAIAGQVETLVTFNVRDFPAAATEPFNIHVTDPDLFLCHLLDENQRGCEEAVEREASRMLHPPQSRRQILAGVAATAPTFANIAHAHWQETFTDILPFAAPQEESPFERALKQPDFSDPLHTTFYWWNSLQHRHDDEVALEALHALTWSPEAFGDYSWVDDLLSAKSLASRVYHAVDDRIEDVAYMRFVPEVAESSQLFASYKGHGAAAYVTLRRDPSGRWRVWGIGSRLASTHEVLT